MQVDNMLFLRLRENNDVIYVHTAEWLYTCQHSLHQLLNAGQGIT